MDALYDCKGRPLALGDSVLAKHAAKVDWADWCFCGKVVSPARSDGWTGCDIKREFWRSGHTGCDNYHQANVIFKWERNLLKIPEEVAKDQELIDAFLVLSGLKAPND